MAYLLDTVALVMWWGGSPQLGARARDVLETAEADIRVSPVSAWEIANKNRIGKLPQFDGFAARFPVQLNDSGFGLLDLTAAHAMRADYLSGAHRDPFDRLLAGQALSEGLTVVTNDSEIARFGCEVLW